MRFANVLLVLLITQVKLHSNIQQDNFNEIISHQNYPNSICWNAIYISNESYSIEFEVGHSINPAILHSIQESCSKLIHQIFSSGKRIFNHSKFQTSKNIQTQVQSSTIIAHRFFRLFAPKYNNLNGKNDFNSKSFYLVEEKFVKFLNIFFPLYICILFKLVHFNVNKR